VSKKFATYYNQKASLRRSVCAPVAMPALLRRLERTVTMSFHRWLQNLFTARKAKIYRRPTCRFAVEELEDRRVPATLLSVSDATLIEGNSGTTNALVTVKLSNSSNPQVSVNYSTANGTALAGSDYQAASGTLTFKKGEMSKMILVPVIGDRLHEANETFFVNLRNATHATIADGQGVVTITDDDPLVNISDVTITEGNAGTTQCNFLVTLSSAPTQAVTVNYATADGSASAGSDYQAASGVLTFNPGQSSQNVTVLVNGDRLGESNEYFFVNLTSANGADGQGVATIVDDEPRISVGAASAVEGNDGTTAMVFTVTLSAASDVPVTVDYTTADGAASAGSDYQSASGTLTFAPNETSKTFTVTVNGDRLAEPDEWVNVVLSNAANAVIDGGLNYGTIVNDEPFADITPGFSQPEGNSDTTAYTFTVSLSAPSDGPVYVDYATVDLGASAGSDYQAVSGTLTFAAGETSQTITVLVYGDQVLEYDEYFAVNLSSGAQAVNLIQNDDGPVINISDSYFWEGDAGWYTMEFTVTLSAPATDTVTVDYFTTDGWATADWDYVPTSGTLTFAPGETSQTIYVTILDDTYVEGDENFFVVLNNSSSNSLIQQAWGTGTIADDDYYYDWW
jgi:hypothetical protein